MQSVIDLVTAIGPWGWLILGVVLFALETVVPGIYFAWFGAAAALVGTAALIIGAPFTWQIQTIAFAVVSVALVGLASRYYRPGANKSDVPSLNVRGSEYIGKVAKVAQAIENGRGKVHVSDTIWTAVGIDVPAGTHVRIIGVDGTSLVTEPLADDEVAAATA